MLVSLHTPYVDTSAADLSLALGGPELPALAVRDIDLPGLPRLRLRLLGASHQVVLGGLTETVACLPGRPPHLPDALHDETTGYRFMAAVLRPDGDGLRTRVAALRAAHAAGPYARVGVVPRAQDAVPPRSRRPPPPDGVLAWRTWHVYPQTNELVLTETVVEEL